MFKITDVSFSAELADITPNDAPRYAQQVSKVWRVTIGYGGREWINDFYSIYWNETISLAEVLEITVSDIDSIEDMARGARLEAWLDFYGYTGSGGTYDLAGVEAWNSIVLARMQLEVLFGEDYETALEAVRNGDFNNV